MCMYKVWSVQFPRQPAYPQRCAFPQMHAHVCLFANIYIYMCASSDAHVCISVCTCASLVP